MNVAKGPYLVNIVTKIRNTFFNIVYKTLKVKKYYIKYWKCFQY